MTNEVGFSSSANRLANLWKVREGFVSELGSNCKDLNGCTDDYKNCINTVKTCKRNFEGCRNVVETCNNTVKTCRRNFEGCRNVVETCTDERAKFKGMKALYFKWLIDMLDKKMVKKYSSLLLHLYKDYFIESPLAPMDVHRARDGIGLRTRFIQENKFGDEQLEELKYDDCSWLEMLIALSIRIDDQLMFDMNLGNRTDNWFWLIIKQMDLDIYDEEHYIYTEVRNKLNKFIKREYENGGKNGIFKCNYDVREVEIWYQMHAWFNENTPKIEF